MNPRRDFLARAAVLAGAPLLAPIASACAAASGRAPAAPAGSASALVSRPIPSTGEALPVIGMGTSGSFEVGPGATERAPLREVLTLLLEGGGRVIDTSPNYGTAEDVLGDLLAERKLHSRVFLASKLAAEGRQAGRAQFERSLQRLRAARLDLLQVHNLRDWRTQLALARELKDAGRVRYVGLTHYLDSAHDALADAIGQTRPDFVQVNYSVLSRNAEKRVLPIAQEVGAAVIVNRAYEDGRLFARVRDRPLPGWAPEVHASTWAQLFLKFVLSHPAATVVIPATGKAKHQHDNLQAGHAPMLDRRQRRLLIEALEA